MQKLINDNNRIISFYREKDKDRIIGIFNFSDKPITAGFKTQYMKGNYTDFNTGQNLALSGSDSIGLKAWDYKILIKQ